MLRLEVLPFLIPAQQVWFFRCPNLCALRGQMHGLMLSFGEIDSVFMDVFRSLEPFLKPFLELLREDVMLVAGAVGNVLPSHTVLLEDVDVSSAGRSGWPSRDGILLNSSWRLVSGVALGIGTLR